MTFSRLVCSLAFVLALACCTEASYAQQGNKIHRIGFVALVSPSTTEAWLRSFRDELRRQGFEEGKNLVIDAKFARGNRGRLKELVIELARLKVDVFLAAGEPSLLAAKSHGENIPIVTVGCDPLERLLGSLARPGGNATGFTCISSDLGSKRLGLLKALLPGGRRIGVLYSEQDNQETELQETTAIGRQLDLEVLRYPVRSADDFERTFNLMTAQKCDALYILASSFANLHRGKFAELALAHKMPAIYGFREFADAGGLMAYGAPLRDGFRRAGFQVAKMLNGTPASEIPVEQPTTFELVLNLKTAQLLEISIPESLLVQAHELIE